MASQAARHHTETNQFKSRDAQDGDFLLAEKFNLAVALVDMHANVHRLASETEKIVQAHPALINSTKRLGLLSHKQSGLFRVALRAVLSGQDAMTLRADDGCMGAPLALQVSPWRCDRICLVSFQPLAPRRIDLSHLSNPFDLTARQLHLLELFTEGLSLAEIAQSLGLRPQTIREAFCELYGRFELRNQLELLSALNAPALTQTSRELPLA
ncbi:LuxR C-terminal-related transcriptional regulator [uncultured Sulfitobacter sp.]|uniref:helix-turn-helix transcriptional regulator n=1 Tax=uncultured Sulfitobacter sp. TaxID=191468 RepID=UPI00260E6CD3|nr:LuxR C-terminal-related transcriptional regulator [uncultured Sulfitobacter sp.]